jgi:hypothetical protein
MSRPCKLQINSAGAWRDLLRFDIDQVNADALQAAAASLVEIADPAGKTTLRICMADALQSTLVRWSADTGWRPA